MTSRTVPCVCACPVRRISDTNPGDDLPPTDWEVVTDLAGEVIGVICPACLTSEEQHAIDEDAMDALEELRREGELATAGSCRTKGGAARP